MAGIEQNPGPARQHTSRRPQTALKMRLLNARSAVNKAAQIHSVIDDSDLDILILTETWIARNAPRAIKEDIAPDGYKIHHAHRSAQGKRNGTKKSGGGIAIVYRDCFSVNSTNSSIGYGTTTFEYLSVFVSFNNRRINVIGVYRPPPSPDSTFYSQFSDMLDAVDLLPEETLLCGDFNCPGNTSTTIDTRLSQLISDHNFTQYVTESTRGHPGNILDLIIGRIGGLAVTNVNTTEVGFSDHNLVTFNIEYPAAIDNIKSFSFRDMKKIDLHKFSDQIRRAEIYVSPPSDVNEFVNLLESTVTSALDEKAQLKTFTKRVGRKTSTVWMSTEAKMAKATARKCERRFRRTQPEDDYVEYRHARSLASKAVGSAQTSYLRDELKRGESTNGFRAR